MCVAQPRFYSCLYLPTCRRFKHKLAYIAAQLFSVRKFTIKSFAYQIFCGN